MITGPMWVGLAGGAPARLVGALLLTMLMMGCGDREVRLYRVAKQPEPPPTGAPTPSSPVSAAPSKIHWQLPKGWEELPPGEIRLGDFRVRGANGTQAEVSIVPLPGQAGRDVDNVNRWRAQVGLGPITEEQLAAQSDPVEIAAQPVRLYNMAGTSADDEKKRILAAILRRGETAWFFKMIGPDALVQSEQATFKEFLRKISFDGGSETQAAAPAVATSPAEPTTAPAHPKWKVPADWREQPPGQMQTAKFSLDGKAEVTVAAFPGDVGGTLANVNRWRGQLGLAPVDSAELPKQVTSVEVGGVAILFVDMTTENRQRRLVAAIAPRAGQTWFFKLLGDEPSVAGAKEAFVQFVKSAN